jgi:hypothetical protein
MPSSEIIDVAIGIAFIFLFFSLICSVVNEAIASAFSLRSKNLVAGLNSLFSESKLNNDGRLFVQAIYENGLVRALYKDPQTPDRKTTSVNPPAANVGSLFHVPSVLQTVANWVKVDLPSYIPSRTFSSALLDVLVPPTNGEPRDLGQLRSAITSLPDSPTKNALLSLAASTQKDLAEFQTKAEMWFNDSMDRAAGWYKRKTQKILLVLGLLVAITMNVDTIRIAKTLWTNPAARQATADLAQQFAQSHKEGLQTDEELKKQAQNLADLGQQLPVPFGWGTEQKNDARSLWDAVKQHTFPAWFTSFFALQKLAGWLITALALSLGAPFWFDTLNKFMSVRSTVRPKTEDGKS